MTYRVVITHWSNGVSDIELVNGTDHVGVWQSHPSMSPEYARDWAEEQATRLGSIIGCPVEGHRRAASQEKREKGPIPAPYRLVGIAYEILETSPSVTVADVCAELGLDVVNGHDYLRIRDALDSQPGLTRVHGTDSEWWEPR